MTPIDKVNSQIVDSLQKAQDFAMGPAIKASGAGKAYQAVAQSTAIAIQDATDYLRNTGTITNTAIGVALAEWLVTKEEVPYKDVIQAATGAMEAATTNFSKVGTAAAAILNGYPSGS